MATTYIHSSRPMKHHPHLHLVPPTNSTSNEKPQQPKHFMKLKPNLFYDSRHKLDLGHCEIRKLDKSFTTIDEVPLPLRTTMDIADLHVPLQ